MSEDENSELFNIFEQADREVSRSRDPRAIRRLDPPELTEEEKREWKEKLSGLFDLVKKRLDNEAQSSSYDDWIEEQRRLARRGPALIDPLNPPEAGRVRKLDLENEILSMKEDIVNQLSSLAEDIIRERLQPKNKMRIEL